MVKVWHSLKCCICKDKKTKRRCNLCLRPLCNKDSCTESHQRDQHQQAREGGSLCTVVSITLKEYKRTQAGWIGAFLIRDKRRKCHACGKRVGQLCSKCGRVCCKEHKEHCCLGAELSEITDYHADFGRMWFQEDFVKFGQSPAYSAKAEALANKHSRDAFGLDTPKHHSHRTQHVIEQLLTDIAGDKFCIAAFEASGSGANNRLVYLANYWVNRQQRAGQLRQTCVLVMDGAVVASFGELAVLSSRKWVDAHVQLFRAPVQDKQVCLALSLLLAIPGR